MKFFAIFLLFPALSLASTCGELSVDISAVSSLKEIKSQKELDDLSLQIQNFFEVCLAEMKTKDSSLSNDAIQILNADKPVQTKIPIQGKRFKSSYKYIVIDPSKVSEDSKDRTTVLFKRLAKMYPSIKIYIDPMRNKESETLGFFDPAVTTHLALYLDEKSMVTFLTDDPFDDTLMHETRHLSFEMSRRRLRPSTVYDYSLTTMNNSQASQLDGYTDYLSFEEIHNWVNDLKRNVDAIRKPPRGETLAKLMESVPDNISSVQDLMVNNEHNGVLYMTEVLEKVLSGQLAHSEVEVNLVEEEGIEFKYKDYVLTNSSPKVVSQFKKTVFTKEGKMEVVKFFTDDLRKMRKAMEMARDQLVVIENDYEELKRVTGTNSEISELASYLQRSTKKLQLIFSLQYRGSPLK